MAPFPFTNLRGVKRRPAVIVSSSKELGDDVIVAFISSKVSLQVTPNDYVLETTHPDFAQTGLKTRSIFKMDKLMTIEKSIISGEIGEVSDSILKELNTKLRAALDL